MGSFSLTQVCYEEEVGHEVNDTISYLLEKEGKLLAIYGNPVDKVECMFEQGFYYSVFYFLSMRY